MPFQLPKSLGKSRQGGPARTRNSTASRNSRLSFAVTPLSDALPGSNDAIFSQAASLTTNRSRSTNAQTPPIRGLNRNHPQRGSPECQQVLALPWHSIRLLQAEVGLAEGTSEAHGLGQVIEKRLSDGRKARVRRWSLGLFPPAAGPQVAGAAANRTRSASSAHADAAPAMSGPQSGRARVPLSAAD